MSERESVQMTQADLEALDAEIVRLETDARRAIAQRIATAREWGDLKENAEYHDAKNDQAMLETKILQLREKQLAAEVVEVEASGDVVGFGSRVEVRDDRDRTRTYVLVAVTEAEAAAGRISVESPVGKALRGARLGATVAVPTPKGERRLTVTAIG